MDWISLACNIDTLKYLWTNPSLIFTTTQQPFMSIIHKTTPHHHLYDQIPNIHMTTIQTFITVRGGTKVPYIHSSATNSSPVSLLYFHHKLYSYISIFSNKFWKTSNNIYHHWHEIYLIGKTFEPFLYLKLSDY